MILVTIVPPNHTPVSKGSGVTDCMPGILRVSDARIKAGKITEIKLINTMLIENRNTIHGTICDLVPESASFCANLIFTIQ